MDVFEVAWGALIGLFLLLEVRALSVRRNKSGTFTAFARRITGTDTRPVRWRAYPIGVAWLAASVWWLGHVLLNWGP